ncbi:MAG: hypothetical protein OXI56_00415 [bacterium]|nr:hypothetical protein [bacterium]MDE0600239.1 hypothetical protein [bacterium]
MTRASQRSALREAGFTGPQTNALAMVLDEIRTDLDAIRIDIRWMKWVGGAIGLAVLAEMVSGLF